MTEKNLLIKCYEIYSEQSLRSAFSLLSISISEIKNYRFNLPKDKDVEYSIIEPLRIVLRAIVLVCDS